jgi:hypothetical protein
MRQYEIAAKNNPLYTSQYIGDFYVLDTKGIYLQVKKLHIHTKSFAFL